MHEIEKCKESATSETARQLSKVYRMHTVVPKPLLTFSISCMLMLLIYISDF